MAINPTLAMLAIQSAPIAIGTLQQLFGQLRNPTAEAAMASTLPPVPDRVTPEDFRRGDPAFDRWSDDEIYESVMTGKADPWSGISAHVPSDMYMEIPPKYFKKRFK